MPLPPTYAVRWNAIAMADRVFGLAVGRAECGFQVAGLRVCSRPTSDRSQKRTAAAVAGCGRGRLIANASLEELTRRGRVDSPLRSTVI